MTDIEHGGPGDQRHHRVVRVFHGIAVPLFALIACYSLLKTVRGDPDSYPYEHLRNFTLTGAIALFSSTDFVRSKRGRWAVLGGMFTLLTLHIWLTHASAPSNWITGAAALLLLAGVLIGARALWPGRGIPRAEWQSAPVTPQELRAVCLGMAVFMPGCALMLLSLVDFKGARWEAIAVVGAATTLFIVGAMIFLRLHRRIGEAEQNKAPGSS